MKTLYTLFTLSLFTLVSFAQSDTTKIKIGEKELEFILKDSGSADSLEIEIEKEVESAMEEMAKELKNLENADEEPAKEKKIDYKDFAFLSGIEIYTNLLLNDDMNINGIDGPVSLEADPARSINVGFTLLDKYIPIAKQHVGIVTGLTFRFVSYNFTESFELDAGQNGELGVTLDDTRAYSKNRLRAGFVRIPLMLQFATGKEKKKSFHVAGGVYAGLRMGKGKYKTEYTQNNQNFNSTSKGHYHLNSYDYGLEARVGHGKMSLIGSYSLAGVFKDDSNVDLTGANVGVALTF